MAYLAAPAVDVVLLGDGCFHYFSERLMYAAYLLVERVAEGVAEACDADTRPRLAELVAHYGFVNLPEFDEIVANLLENDALRMTEEEDEDGTGETLAGAASSPGIYTGKVRVILDIRDLGQVQKGEILVTSNTDPGWTPVFSKLGGLITETGGILSHGAVISREYKIPAVTAVKNATTLLRTGQTVHIDGGSGHIRIEDE